MTVDLLTNPAASRILTAKFGARVRWTVNPIARVAGNSVWDAGAVEDWCELPPDVSPEGAALELAARTRVSGREGRVQRQAAAHDTGLCNRKAPHWPLSGVS